VRTGSRSSVFDRLTDSSLFVAAHRHRFDSHGKGRGLAGRVEGWDQWEPSPRTAAATASPYDLGFLQSGADQGQPRLSLSPRPSGVPRTPKTLSASHTGPLSARPPWDDSAADVVWSPRSGRHDAAGSARQRLRRGEPSPRRIVKNPFDPYEHQVVMDHGYGRSWRRWADGSVGTSWDKRAHKTFTTSLRTGSGGDASSGVNHDDHGDVAAAADDDDADLLWGDDVTSAAAAAAAAVAAVGGGAGTSSFQSVVDEIEALADITPMEPLHMVQLSLSSELDESSDLSEAAAEEAEEQMEAPLQQPEPEAVSSHVWHGGTVPQRFLDGATMPHTGSAVGGRPVAGGVAIGEITTVRAQATGRTVARGGGGSSRLQAMQQERRNRRKRRALIKVRALIRLSGASGLRAATMNGGLVPRIDVSMWGLTATERQAAEAKGAGGTAAQPLWQRLAAPRRQPPAPGAGTTPPPPPPSEPAIVASQQRRSSGRRLVPLSPPDGLSARERIRWRAARKATSRRAWAKLRAVVRLQGAGALRRAAAPVTAATAAAVPIVQSQKRSPRPVCVPPLDLRMGSGAAHALVSAQQQQRREEQVLEAVVRAQAVTRGWRVRRRYAAAQAALLVARRAAAAVQATETQLHHLQLRLGHGS
jgi:hypothetical protein